MDDRIKSLAATHPDDKALRQAQLEISQALFDWVDAVNSGKIDTVTALYAPNATLLATFAPQPRTTPEERKDYFDAFLARKNLRATIDESFTNALSDDAGETSGLYTFTFQDDAGATQTVKARFTFVYERLLEGDWLIAAHHSSVVPG